MAGRTKSTEQPTKQNGSFADITKELWEAAVQLRGSIEPADYKRYVLPIIFLRSMNHTLSALIPRGRQWYLLLVNDGRRATAVYWEEL